MIAEEKVLAHNWTYWGDPQFPKSIFRDYTDGTSESTTTDNPEIIAWLEEGNEILPTHPHLEEALQPPPEGE